MKTLITIVTVLALGACGKKDKPAPEPGSASAAPVATGSGSGSETAAGSGSAVAAGSGSAAEPAVDLPTEMDYEELAAEEITDKTVEARLKDLEGQLSAQ